MYVWKILRNGQEEIARMDQSDEEYETDGRGNALAGIIPLEHEDAAQEGEWDEEGFTYHVGEDYYVVTYRRE